MRVYCMVNCAKFSCCISPQTVQICEPESVKFYILHPDQTNVFLRIITRIFLAKNWQKNKNIQPGPKKQYFYNMKKEYAVGFHCDVRVVQPLPLSFNGGRFCKTKIT